VVFQWRIIRYFGSIKDTFHFYPIERRLMSLKVERNEILQKEKNAFIMKIKKS